MWNWHILTNTSMSFSYSNIFIENMGKKTCSENFSVQTQFHLGSSRVRVTVCYLYVLTLCLVELSLMRTAEFYLLRKKQHGNFTIDFRLPQTSLRCISGILTIIFTDSHIYNFPYLETRHSTHPTYFRPSTIHSDILQMFWFQKLRVLHNSLYFKYLFPLLSISVWISYSVGKG